MILRENAWPKEVRDVYFDLDNTLWDHRKNAKLCLQDLFPEYKRKLHYSGDFDTFYLAYERSNDFLWDEIAKGAINKESLRNRRFPEALDALEVPNYKIGIELEQAFLDNIIQYNELIEGSLDVLNFLSQKKLKLHILSNGFVEVTSRKVENSALSPYFASITSADEHPKNIRKPHPEIFEFALKKTGANKQHSIMVGDDWLADIVGSEDFGMASVFLDIPNASNKNFSRTITRLLDLLLYF